MYLSMTAYIAFLEKISSVLAWISIDSIAMGSNLRLFMLGK